MNKYAQTAVLAAQYVKIGDSPVQAWKKASCEIFVPDSASQKKACPKNAFIGLYNEGNTLNGQYARKGLNYLKEHSNENITPRELWEIVTECSGKAYNSQMDVVIALYKKGLLQQLWKIRSYKIRCSGSKTQTKSYQSIS